MNEHEARTGADPAGRDRKAGPSEQGGNGERPQAAARIAEEGRDAAYLVGAALHHLRRGARERFEACEAELDALLASGGASPEELLRERVLKGLYQLGRFEALEKALGPVALGPAANDELRYLYGQVLYRLGRTDEAVDVWSAVSGDADGFGFLRVRLRQLREYPGAVLGGGLIGDEEPEVHVLILTKDREPYLRKTLACLARTAYSNYRVYILDNGSADRTAEVLREAPDLLGPDVEVFTQSLPTNIGRPAGHNWLLTNWDHSGARYLSILDDDLLHFEPNWLVQFLNTFAVKPGLAAVGGKTVGADLLVQDATSVINPPAEDGSVSFFTNRGAFDWGQFDYLSNVTDYIIGCACLFRREVFDEVGLFDIRFSPSQGVDIDHGLRMRMAGHDLMYNGNATFVHAQLTSEGLDKDLPRLGNSRGNFLKLGYKYSGPDGFAAVIRDRLVREREFNESQGVFTEAGD